MSKKKIDWRVLITAIICLTAIEICALFNGINGTIMTIVVAAIAGIGGWVAPQLKTK